MATKIAIIEDDLAISQMYRIKFETDGYEVETAENGKQGLELCEKMLPDLIMLDLRMPIMNGDEMLEKLRSTAWGSTMRVIILTNISRDEAPKILSLLNVDRYIVKAHHTPQQIVDIINEIL